MAVRLADDVYWLPNCYDLGGTHLHVSVYLIEHPEGNVLIDTGSFHHVDDILDQIDEVTDGDGVDTLVLSHPDLPHSGNVHSLRTEWDDLELVVFSRTPPIHGFSGATSARRGEDAELAGRRLSWIDAPLADITSTAWVFDHASGTLFTADGFGNYHRPGDCDRTADALDDDVRFDAVHEFNADVLPWLKYVEPGVLHDTLRSLLETYGVECVAPAHGNPLLSEEIDRYMALFERSVRRISERYAPPGE